MSHSGLRSTAFSLVALLTPIAMAVLLQVFVPYRCLMTAEITHLCIIFNPELLAWHSCLYLKDAWALVIQWNT